MKSRYLLSAGAALAVAFGCAEANAQFAFMGGPYPTVFYVGPEGGWTSLGEPEGHDHHDAVQGGQRASSIPTGPFFSGFNGSAKI